MPRVSLTYKLVAAALAILVPSSVALFVVAGRLEAEAPGLRAMVLAVGVIVPICVLAGGAVFARRITRRLFALNESFAALAEGDLDAEVPVESDDEVGRLSAAFNEMLGGLRATRAAERDELASAERLRATLSDYERFAGRVASGDLTARVSVGLDDAELGPFGRHLNEMASRLGSLSAEVRTAATQLTSASGQILSVVRQHTDATTEQAASVAQTSVTIDEVRASASQMADRATALATQARETSEISGEGMDAVEGIMGGMTIIRDRVARIAADIRSLSERIEAIETITRSVNDLADQSNMLALNATIEAARAGEQGRGFAVVAQEVRHLAERSKGATSQVRDILAEIERATATVVRATEEGTLAVEDGVERARRASEILARVESNSEEAAHFATTIAAAVREQYVGMDQIGQAMADVSASSTQMAAGANDTHRAAELLAGLAHTLEDVTGRYRIEPATADPVTADPVVEVAAPEPVPASATASYDGLTRRLAAELGVECAVIARFDDGACVVPLAAALPDGHDLRPFVAEGAGAFATVIRTGAPARIDDYDKLPPDRLTEAVRAGGYRSSVCVPIQRDGRVWGGVLVATRGAVPVTRGAEVLLTRVARRAAQLAQREDALVVAG